MGKYGYYPNGYALTYGDIKYKLTLQLLWRVGLTATAWCELLLLVYTVVV